MDEAYLRQMASLMGWDIVAIKVSSESSSCFSLFLSLSLSLGPFVSSLGRDKDLSRSVQVV